MVGLRRGRSIAGAAAGEGEEVAEGVVGEALGTQRRGGRGLEVLVRRGEAAHLVVREGVGADRLDVARAIVGVAAGGPAHHARGRGGGDRRRAAHFEGVVGVGVGQALGRVRRVVGMDHLIDHQIREVGQRVGVVAGVRRGAHRAP